MRGENNAVRNFSNGFDLTETELRRIVKVVTEQMGKISEDFEIRLKVKFYNGVVSEYTNVDDVLALSNSGSEEITKITIEARDVDINKFPSHNYIEVQFTNSENDQLYYIRPIQFRLSGEQQDWVFTTTKLLEEKISRVKKNFVPYFLNHTRFTGLIGLIMLLGFIGWILLLGFQEDTAYFEKVDQLEKQWKSGVYTDPIEVMFALERIKQGRGDDFFKQQIPASLSFLGMVIIVGVASYFIYFLLTYIPAFNFVWGDYADEFNKKKKVLNFILGTLIGGIAIGILGDIIYDLLK